MRANVQEPLRREFDVGRPAPHTSIIEPALRLEEGRITFHPEDCALHEILAALVRNYGKRSPNHQTILDVDQIPDRITADSRLLC
jgi:hypothetical protein